MKRIKSDIPESADERLIREYGREGPLIYLRVTECIFKDQVVGQRAYDAHGKLMIETPLKDNQKHGREYTWNEQGALESVEPYFEGKLHGVARQYGRGGKVIGTYRFVYGTGFDIWRCERQDGTIGISEIHSLQDGLPHGYEWWLKEDQQSVEQERHWQQGRYHGIERMWNASGRLRRGYPKYWIQGRAVSKRLYLKAAGQDKTLPPFREKDNRPRRSFPAEIEKLFSR